MKTTIELPPELLDEAERVAAVHRTTVGELIARGLEAELGALGRQTRRRAFSSRWVTVPGGLLPEVDLSDRAAMHEWLRRQR